MGRLISKLTFQLEIIIMQRKVKELSYWLAEMKKRILEYYRDFNNPICDEVNVNWQFPPMYYVYFDDDDNMDDDVINNNNNGSAYIIDALLIDNLEVKGKENMCLKQLLI